LPISLYLPSSLPPLRAVIAMQAGMPTNPLTKRKVRRVRARALAARRHI
jgi:hypothetical protein